MKSISVGYITNSSDLVYNITFKPRDHEEFATRFYKLLEKTVSKISDKDVKLQLIKYAKEFISSNFNLETCVPDYDDISLEAMSQFIKMLEQLNDENYGSLRVSII